ncbi:hypothetical protein Pmani_022836 [Petrolisthes manimaculis]|uniref:ATP-dependent helicase ATRX n=1 Tax=Petrolisthes manimaculis TaxID=1843537 RepID=A0AAE1PD82_9EUCA|nr:hypothetical protein Pmani_022836 [Petrolisthes manimaculis]
MKPHGTPITTYPITCFSVTLVYTPFNPTCTLMFLFRNLSLMNYIGFNLTPINPRCGGSKRAITGLLLHRRGGSGDMHGDGGSSIPSLTQSDVLKVLGISSNGATNGESSTNSDVNGEAASGEKTSSETLVENGTNGSVVLQETAENIEESQKSDVMSDSCKDLEPQKNESTDSDVKCSADVEMVEEKEKDMALLGENIDCTDSEVKTKKDDSVDFKDLEVKTGKDDSVDCKDLEVKTGKDDSVNELEVHKETLDSSNAEESGNEDTSNSQKSTTDTESEKSDADSSVVEDEEKKNKETEEKKRRQDDENISYSKTEKKYYHKHSDELQQKLKESVMKCTSCFEQVNHHIRSLVHTHPVLGVFICKKCRKYYGRGKFCKDDEGYDEYCRICAEGGDLLCCEQEGCFNGFCKRCVKRTLGRSELKTAENKKNWACYVCDPTPMMELRALHRAILDNLKVSEEEDDSLSRKDLRTKLLKNKFEALKQIRTEKSIKDQEKEEKNKNKAAAAEIKKKAKEGKIKNVTKDEKKSQEKANPVVKEVLEMMTDMMNQCQQNLILIEKKWKKSDYSPEGTDKARSYLLKQLECICNNFHVMGETLNEDKAKQTPSDVIEGEKKISNDKTEGKKKMLEEDDGMYEKSAQKKANDKSSSHTKVSKNKCAVESNESEGESSKTEKEKSKKSVSGRPQRRKRSAINSDSENTCQIDADSVAELSSKDEQESDEKNNKENNNKGKEKSKKDVTLTELSPVDQFLEKDANTDKDSGQSNKYDQGLDNLECVIDSLLSDADEAIDCVLGNGAADADNLDETAALMETSIDDNIDSITLPDLMQNSENEDDDDAGKNKQKESCSEETKESYNEGTKKSCSEETISGVNNKEDMDSRVKDVNKSDEETAIPKILRVRKLADLTGGQEEEEEENKKRKRSSGAVGKDNDKEGEAEGSSGLRRSSRKGSNEKEESVEKETNSKRRRNKGITEECEDDENYVNSRTTRRRNKSEKLKEEEKDDEKEGNISENTSNDKSKKGKKTVSLKDKKKTQTDSSASEDEEKDKTKMKTTTSEEDSKKSDKEGEQVQQKRGRLRKNKSEETKAKRGKGRPPKHTSKDLKGKTEDEDRENDEKKRAAKRRKRRGLGLDKEDEVMLGLVEGSSGSSEEEDTDTEIQRRREEHMDKREERKNKLKRKKNDQEEGKGDMNEEEEEGEEQKISPVGSEEEETKDKKSNDSPKRKAKQVVKKGSEEESCNESELPPEDTAETNSKKSSNKKNKSRIENEKALSAILASDSDKESDQKPEVGEYKAKPEKKSILETSDEEKDKKNISGVLAQDKESTTLKKKKKRKTENMKAKAALLDSDSEEDKPMPRSRKKWFRNLPKSPRSRRRSIVQKMEEEEKDNLQEKQLEGKCETVVEPLSQHIQKVLEEEEFVYASDYPHLLYPKIYTMQNDDCDADEEDSEKEFSQLMKFNVSKVTRSSKNKQSVKTEPEISKEEDDEEEEENKEEGKPRKKNKKDKGEGKKKKEGLLDIDIDKEEDDDEEEDQEEEEKGKKKKKKEGGMSLNEKMKKQILMSSDEEGDVDEEEEEPTGDLPKGGLTEEEREKKKHEARKKREEEKKKKEADDGDSNGEYSARVAKKGYMNLDISTDEEEKKSDGNDSDYKNEDEDEDDDVEEDNDDEDDSDFEESPRKRRAFQLSSSDGEGDKKKRKRKVSSSEKESEEEEEEKPKSKRKRIRKMSSSSSSDSDDDDEEEKDANKESPSKHKKIRRVIRDEDLLETTKNATQEEEERRKRVTERQQKYNQIFEVDVEADQEDVGKLVLDFDPESKKELISVNEKLVKFLKPHQFKGIKFMWDATVESVEMLKSKPGSGCILAHCMGLGKTLQVITYCHTLLTNKKTNRYISKIMVCCPVNTVYNWVSEFNNWLRKKMLPFDVVELVSAKDLWGRAYRLDDWWREGGICIVGYDMFRNLSNTKNKRFKGKMKEIFQKTLINPGPDVMVCDEGHILKNEKTAMSIALNQIQTQRRIILTGTPLQNNLKEYHCMIQFVKPNLLGTRKEFMNRFLNPIEQGQCLEAMPRDVKRMKRRAHILHNLLEGCVQRFDYTVLQPFLPPKFEYVVSVQLSDIQRKLYQYYLDNLAQGGPKRQGSGLFVDFGALSRVWTHPKVLDLAVRRSMFDDDEDEMDDFICDDSTSESSEDDRRKKKKKQKKGNESDAQADSEIEEMEAEQPGPIPGLTQSGKVRVDWWKKVLLDNIGEDFEEDEFLDKLEHSGKLTLLLEILRECTSIGDKVLVFSQSLLALDMIEDFLGMISDGQLELPQPDDPLPLPYKRWRKEQDYIRLDGSTNAETRKTQCKFFNNPSNDRCRLFLISTRAGGLGINLVGANRVIIFDSSWNPSHDTQSIFRVYRFGQKKPCYVYRFVAQGTMEEKIYSRQVAKMSTALRVVDEHQIKRYFKLEELAQLYEFNPSDVDQRETPTVPEDRLLAELLKRHKDWIVNYHEHDSLLENQTGEELSEEERKAAWDDYENEKKGFMVQQQRNSVMSVVGNRTMSGFGLPSLSLSAFSFEGVVNTIKAQNPNLTQAEMCESVVLATKQIQKIHLNHYQRVQAMVYNLKNPMIAPEQRKLLPFGNHPEMLPMLEQQLRVLEENIQRENQVINHLTQITPQKAETSMANLMAAGLLRGQPSSSGVASSTSDYVTRPANVKEAEGKKTVSNDVIMLD